jgi:hypothetical protein
VFVPTAAAPIVVDVKLQMVLAGPTAATGFGLTVTLTIVRGLVHPFIVV